MNQVFLEKLSKARQLVGFPFIIKSGYRCAQHNRDVGSKYDNHTKGVAADIWCVGGPLRVKMVKAFLDVGFKRIGIGESFIHVDTNNRDDSMWIYW